MTDCHMASVMVEARAERLSRLFHTAPCTPLFMHSGGRHFKHVAAGFVDSSTEKCRPGLEARNDDWMHVNAVEVQEFAGRVLESRTKALASGGAGQERKARTEPPKERLDGHHLCERLLARNIVAH